MLHELRVLDLSRVLAGPLCTMMLGDLGARVLKVERPARGDDTRGWGPPFDERGESAYFLSVNRNKLGLAADLADPDDRRLIAELVAGADVVVENYRPGSLRRLGLDPAEMVARHDRLVWCTITGFGSGSDRPGYDFVVQAEMGWMAITGEADGDPMKVGVALADVIAGKDAAAAILGTLLARERAGISGRALTPTDRHIEISLARSAAAALVNVAQNVLVSGEDARRWGNGHPNLVPYQLFEATDRAIVIAVGSDDQWRALLRVVDAPELDDDALATNAGRVLQRERVVSALARCVRLRGAAEWHALFERAGVPSGVVRTVREVVGECGGSPVTGMPPAIGGAPARRPPLLDEHGESIRARGWDAFDD